VASVFATYFHLPLSRPDVESLTEQMPSRNSNSSVLNPDLVDVGLNSLGAVAENTSDEPGGPSFLDLFDDLSSNAGSSYASEPERAGRVAAGMNRLRTVAENSASDDRRYGPPSCKVKVAGDPEIIDKNKGYFHYLGPALLVNLDDRGMVRSLEFVSAEGGKKDSNYIKEVWQYNVKTQTYKYRDLRSMQGVPVHNCKDQVPRPRSFWGDSWTSQGDIEFHAGDVSWQSELEPDARPSREFLQQFKPNSETFFVNIRSGMFTRGPQYGMLRAVVENPALFIRPLILSCSKDADVWMERAADAITKKPPPTKRGKIQAASRQEQAVQVAQLVFGLTACVQRQEETVPQVQQTLQQQADPWRNSGADPWARRAN